MIHIDYSNFQFRTEYPIQQPIGTSYGYFVKHYCVHTAGMERACRIFFDKVYNSYNFHADGDIDCMYLTKEQFQ